MATAGSERTQGASRCAARLSFFRLVGAALLLAGCTVNVPRYAFNAALENQKHVNELRMGQTLVEVERVMRKPPERRNARLRFDGVSIEEWSYVTDPVRKLDTVITFVGGKVFEINTAPWGGEEEERDPKR